MQFRVIRFLFCTLLLGSFVPGQAQQVWPGDVNNNGIVNAVDLMYVGYAFGSTGPSRLMQSTDWNPQFLPVPWVSDFPDGTNFSYADCNGDGLVDIEDIFAVYLNFGLTHGQVTMDVFPSGVPNVDPSFVFQPHISKYPYYPGDTVRVDLVLGSSSLPLQDVFGLSFILGFDLVGRDAIRFQLDSSWINPGGEPIISVFNNLGSQQLAINVQQFGNGTPTQGGGSIGTLEIIIEENLVGVTPNDTVVFGLCLDDVLVMDSSFNPIPVFTPCFETGVTETVTSIEWPTARHEGYRIFPNPATEKVWIASAARDKQGIRAELIDSQGRVVQSKALSRSNSAIELTDLPAGFYVVKIHQKTGPPVRLPLVIK